MGTGPEKIITKKDTCFPVFIEALFTGVRTWKQPKSPSTDEWIKMPWCVYIMEGYLIIKRSAFESVPMKWMKQKAIIQSEVSQKEKNKCHILMHIYGV